MEIKFNSKHLCQKFDPKVPMCGGFVSMKIKEN